MQVNASTIVKKYGPPSATAYNSEVILFDADKSDLQNVIRTEREEHSKRLQLEDKLEQSVPCPQEHD